MYYMYLRKNAEIRVGERLTDELLERVTKQKQEDRHQHEESKNHRDGQRDPRGPDGR